MAETLDQPAGQSWWRRGIGRTLRRTIAGVFCNGNISHRNPGEQVSTASRSFSSSLTLCHRIAFVTIRGISLAAESLQRPKIIPSLRPITKRNFTQHHGGDFSF